LALKRRENEKRVRGVQKWRGEKGGLIGTNLSKGSDEARKMEKKIGRCWVFNYNGLLKEVSRTIKN